MVLKPKTNWRRLLTCPPRARKTSVALSSRLNSLFLGFRRLSESRIRRLAYSSRAIRRSDLIDILIAGHIVPWRDANESERLEIGNAILLSPLYDALFDRHLISFEDDVKIIFSSQLKNKNDLVTCLRIDQVATIAVTEDMKPYLQRHREKLK